MMKSIDSLFSAFLMKYDHTDLERRIKAKSILSVNIAMLFIAGALFPFALDETIWLPIVIGGAFIGFLISIFTLKSGRIFEAAVIHITLIAFIVAFLHLFISDSYDDTLTFIILSMIFIVDCMLVATHIYQIYLFAAIVVLSQVAAPFINLNGKLFLTQTHQIENFILFISYFIIVLITTRTYANLLLTAKNEADHARESENKYRLLAENATDVIWTTDLEMNLTYISPSVERFRGYTVEEVMRQTVEERVAPESAAIAAQALTEELDLEGQKNADPLRSRMLNLESICKDGSTKWSETKISFIRDAAGKAIGILGVSRDMTEHKQAEKEKKILEARLFQSQKMEAIGTLAGGIAHDFNNILAAVIGYTELLQMNLPRNSNEFDYANQIQQAGDRAKDLVQQILTFSRQTEHELKPMEVSIIVKEVNKLLRSSLPTTIEINQNIQTDALVMGDPTQLHQILMNLCTNAGHAMKEKGGLLSIDLKSVELKDDLPRDQMNLKPGTYVQLSVSDSGHGIPADYLDRVFEPFFTTKERGEGTGMGLSVVHGIVESYEGAIYAFSEEGQGSTFEVLLPAIERRTEPDKREKEDIPRGTEHILFVDDEQVLVDLGTSQLESLGYTVSSRSSSLEALALFKHKPDSFDLIITDMTMPEMTGDELTHEIKRIRPDIPVILCTGFSAKITPESAEKFNIQALIMKPIIIKNMAKVIRKVLESRPT